MSDNIKVTWQMDDGYAGGSRPQYTYIDREEYESLETALEKEQFVYDCVQADYDQKGFYIEKVGE